MLYILTLGSEKHFFFSVFAFQYFQGEVITLLTMKTNVTTEGHVLELINSLSSGFSTHLHYRKKHLKLIKKMKIN